MKIFRLLLITFVFLGTVLFSSIAIAQEYSSPEAQVKLLLSARHEPVDRQMLEEMAGGEEVLVSMLLEFRTDEVTPFVAVRSEKLLLEYSHLARVEEALKADLASEERAGLARVMALHIDRVTSEKVRHDLAERIVSRAKREPAYMPYAKNLSDSSDSKVREVAEVLSK